MTAERQALPTWRLRTGLLMAMAHHNANVTKVTLALEMFLHHEETLAFASLEQGCLTCRQALHARG